MLRFFYYILLLLVLASCAGKSSNDLRVSLGLTSAYDVAKTEFHQGLVIQARQRLVAIPKDEKDYDKAQFFLKKEVEPARLKLLRYYARKGKAEEKNENWAAAEEAYHMAAELSQRPRTLQKYQSNMNLKVRQLRLNSLYTEQKKADAIWLEWKDAYVPPKGLLGDDKSFSFMRNNNQKSLAVYTKQTWGLAEYYKKKDVPELAWLYADAYLRFSAGDKKAQDLKNAMATALPKGFVLPQEKAAIEKNKITVVVKQTVTVAQVKALMKQKKWKVAKHKALVLRKQGNKKANKLLKDINANMIAQAEEAYQKGNLAFRTEKIDEAVSFWQEAVDLRPNEQTYIDSLGRGKQIQERLRALKSEDK